MRIRRTDRRNDAFAHTCQHRLLAGSAHELFDIGPNRYAGLGDELDAVLGHGRHRRRVDDLRIHRHLHRLEHIAAREVDGRGHLEVEHDVGFLSRDECMDHVRNVASRKIMGLQFVGIEVQAGFRALDHRRDDHRRRHLAPAHQYELQQTEPHARHERREPKPHRDEIEDEPDGEEAHEDDQYDHSDLKVHDIQILSIGFTITLAFSNPTTSTSVRGST